MPFNRTRSWIILSAAALAAANLGALAVAAQSRPIAVPIVQISGIPIPGGGGLVPVPWGNGGTYGGPGDTVPPGPGEHHIGMCTMSLPPAVCDASPACSLGWEWEPDQPRCVWPQFGPATGYQHYAQGFRMTISTMVDLLENAGSCVDQQGNITICIDAPFPTHEVHVFESGWINGYERTAAIEDAVSTAVCIDGEIVMAGWAFDEIARAAGCTYPQVCITFNAECMWAALQDWAEAGINLDAWGDAWRFYVDFVRCDPCD